MKKITQSVKNKGGNISSYAIETTLCAYRKHFKGTRYNGYYADRQLEEMYGVLEKNPNMEQDFESMLEARRQALPNEYLGELGGWRGIRRDLKQAYLSDGKVIGYGD